jgi:hypothetical protein
MAICFKAVPQTVRQLLFYLPDQEETVFDARSKKIGQGWRRGDI